MGLLQDILNSQFKDAHEKAKRKQSGVEEPSLLGALKDPQFRQDVKRGLLDSLNRGAVASTIGGPVDLATLALRPLGYNVEKPVLGSEWVGDKMQQMGLLGDTRNPIAEAIASVAVPGAMTKAGQGLFKAEQTAIKNAQMPSPMNGAMRGQMGAAKVPYSDIRPQYMSDLVDVLKSGKAKDVPFGKITPRTEQQVNALREVLGEPLIQRGDQWVIPEGVVDKFIQKRIGPKVTPEKFVDDLNSAIHNSGNRAFQTKYSQNQGLLTTGEGNSQLAFVSVNPKTGEPVIKSGHPVNTENLPKELSEGKGLLSTGGTQSTIVNQSTDGPTGAILPGYAESNTSLSTRQPFVYPQDAALETARQNGVKMLGLPENNTPMDRAKALGANTDAFHGGTSDYTKIKKNKVTPYGDRFFSTPDPDYASEYAMGGAITGDTQKVKAWREANSNDAGPNVMPLLLGEHKASSFSPVEFVSRPWKGPLGEKPQLVRSRFAAFDPARVNENDLLAGAMPFGLLLDPENRAKLGLGQ